MMATTQEASELSLIKLQTCDVEICSFCLFKIRAPIPQWAKYARVALN